MLRKCFLSNYLEPQNAKWQFSVLSQYCYFNLLELAYKEEHVNKIVWAYTTYSLSYRTSSLTLSTTSKGFLNPCPWTANLGIQITGPDDQQPRLAEFTPEEPAVPPHSLGKFTAQSKVEKCPMLFLALEAIKFEFGILLYLMCTYPCIYLSERPVENNIENIVLLI